MAVQAGSGRSIVDGQGGDASPGSCPGDHPVATQRSGQPPDEGGEHGPVGPVQAWSWVGAAQHGDLVAQHEELDVLGGGRSGHQQEQSEHLPEDQVQQP